MVILMIIFNQDIKMIDIVRKKVYLINENAFMGCEELQLIYGESEFAEEYAEKKEKIYVDFKRIREEGNQVW